MIYYDFHIHSCLSPCANDDMTPNNIINMAYLKELDCIAICDHNSIHQQIAVSKIDSPIKVLYGIEVETSEEVHVLGLFEDIEKNQEFGKWVENNLNDIKNDPKFFGNQLILNEKDETIGTYDTLLLQSIKASLNETIDKIHECKGAVILAHVLDRKNSITYQLGFIPKGIKADALEVKSIEEINKVKQEAPYLEEYLFVIDSDAHQLIDISEKENQLSSIEFERLLRPCKI